ncbi:hypothetical protein CP6013_01952 [Clostridium pasteurianum DSM 525 = ATCC 6013]|uniref:Uncharacterized protein n=2 Tax=Clostridium pasteurianum DSM 525 = ATCC 6013 TaxID=1262449 RepID=A0A837S910_CLOPA|nr:hypothetical protein CP6013_01952 [Clostridium pasteurianum DSM 525 = ATCC 6013]
MIKEMDIKMSVIDIINMNFKRKILKLKGIKNINMVII